MGISRDFNLSLVRLLGGEDLDGLVEGRGDGDTALLVEIDDLLANHGDVYRQSGSYPRIRQKG